MSRPIRIAVYFESKKRKKLPRRRYTRELNCTMKRWKYFSIKMGIPLPYPSCCSANSTGRMFRSHAVIRLPQVEWFIDQMGQTKCSADVSKLWMHNVVFGCVLFVSLMMSPCLLHPPIVHPSPFPFESAPNAKFSTRTRDETETETLQILRQHAIFSVFGNTKIFLTVPHAWNACLWVQMTMQLPDMMKSIVHFNALNASALAHCCVRRS